MASYSVDKVKHATLVATVVDTITFKGAMSGVRLTNRSALGAIYVCIDGTNPGIASDDSYVVLNEAEKVFYFPDPESATVKLVCAAGAQYSVEGI